MSQANCPFATQVKLGDDMLSLFPDYIGEVIWMREDRKTVVNLRAAHPERLAETLVKPAAIQLCFVERRGTAQTLVQVLYHPPRSGPCCWLIQSTGMRPCVWRTTRPPCKA